MAARFEVTGQQAVPEASPAAARRTWRGAAALGAALLCVWPLRPACAWRDQAARPPAPSSLLVASGPDVAGIAQYLGESQVPADPDQAPAWRRPSVAPGSLCTQPIAAAERRHGVPTGLLLAIALVESGRPVSPSGGVAPWPWSVNANGQGYYLDSRAEAVDRVQQAQARAATSIDVGCMQVNLQYHPDAFATLEQAFDPAINTDYAARFLASLHQMTGNWLSAAGAYHSRTPNLATPYQSRVATILRAPPGPVCPPQRTEQDAFLAQLASAWRTTLGEAAATIPVPVDVAASCPRS